MLKLDSVELRPISEEDTQQIVKWRNSESVKSQLFTRDYISEDDHLWWIKNKVETGDCAQFIIETGNPKHKIGTVFIKNIDNKNNKGEFGIFIGEEMARGKGYGIKATKLILDFAFNDLKLNRIYLYVFSDNLLGIKSYTRAGFHQEGILRQDYKEKDGYRDVMLMSILKREWMEIGL